MYYRGNNDAWDGYGGGTLYTRSSTVPEAVRRPGVEPTRGRVISRPGQLAEFDLRCDVVLQIVPEVKASLEAAGLDWSKWAITDNTCGPEPKVIPACLLGDPYGWFLFGRLPGSDEPRHRAVDWTFPGA